MVVSLAAVEGGVAADGREGNSPKTAHSWRHRTAMMSWQKRKKSGICNCRVVKD